VAQLGGYVEGEGCEAWTLAAPLGGINSDQVDKRKGLLSFMVAEIVKGLARTDCPREGRREITASLTWKDSNGGWLNTAEMVGQVDAGRGNEALGTKL